jgi:hypothetical protein
MASRRWQTPRVPYEVLAQRWRDFYIVSGTAAATLVGLLFVGLSLHLRAVLSRSEVRALARVTLANFGLVLFVSLFMLIPQSATATGRFLIVGGIFTIAVIVPSLVATIRSRTRTLGAWEPYVRFGSSVLAYAAVILAGWFLGRGSLDAAFRALLVVVLVLTVVSLRNSWDLLVSVGAATILEPSERDG